MKKIILTSILFIVIYGLFPIKSFAVNQPPVDDVTHNPCPCTGDVCPDSCPVATLTPTPTATPTPTITISTGLLNSSSGLSCEQYCLQEKNLHCASIGTDLAGTNGDFVYYNGNYARCYTVANYTCSHVLADLSAYNKTCAADAHSGYTVDSTAHTPQWTYCKCFGSVTTPTATPTPTITPTSNPACICDTGDVCNAANCAYDKFNDVAYNNPIKCSREASIVGPTPNSTNKNNYCNRTLRVKGDANGDLKVDISDYAIYLRAILLVGISPDENPDFNGDGIISPSDLLIYKHARPE